MAKQNASSGIQSAAVMVMGETKKNAVSLIIAKQRQNLTQKRIFWKKSQKKDRRKIPNFKKYSVVIRALMDIET